MGYFSFPHTRSYDSDLGWLIHHIKEIDEKLNEYLENSVITFADPIQWDITQQYSTLMMVIDSDGTAYLSKQPVPAGVQITNTDYWMPIFNYNDSINKVKSSIATVATSSGTTPTALNENALIWYDGEIYKTLSSLPAGSLIIPGSNAEKITLEDWIDAIVQTLANDIADANNDIIILQNDVLQLRADVDDLINNRGVINCDTAQDIINIQAAAGALIRTAGYYSINDGGSALYRVSQSVPSHYYEVTANNYFAEIIIDDTMDVLTYGITSGTNASKLQSMIDDCTGSTIVSKNDITIPITNTITISSPINLNVPNVTLAATAPIDFIKIQSDDVSVSISGSIDDTYTDLSAGTFIDIGSCSNVEVHHCTGETFLNFITILDDTIEYCSIHDNIVHAHYCDIYIDKVNGHDLVISKNHFYGSKTYDTPVTSVGGMRIAFGFVRHGLMPGITSEQITDTIFNNKFNNVTISGNKTDYVNARFITVCNAQYVTIENNTARGAEGIVTTPGISDDMYVVEYCYNAVLKGNYCEYSGQNGIDILASKYVSVIGNVIKGCYTHAIAFDLSDCYRLGYAVNLSMINEIPMHCTISGNTFNARAYLFDIRLGQNFTFTGNDLSKFKLSSELTYPGHAIGFEMLPELQTFVTAYHFQNIEFSGNTINDNAPNNIIQNGTSTYYDWESISLEESLALESDWLTANAATGYTIWSRSATECGVFQHYKLFFDGSPYIGATYKFPALSAVDGGAIPINGLLPVNEGGTLKTNGAVMWANMSQTTYIKLGDYISGIPQMTVGEMINMGQITSGRIKIKLW